VNGVDWGEELRRYALPVLLLAVVTAAAFAVRGALTNESAEPAAKPRPAERVAPRAGVQRAAAKFHVVEYGDTLGELADTYETSVERLVELNPGIEPAALRVGQRVRVG
jgi:LysM repeat protein